MTDKDILEISSVQNKSVKEIVSLSEKPKIRREKSLFLIEGGRDLKMAAEAGYKIDSVFFEPELLKKRGILGIDELLSIRANAFYKVSPQAYSKMAYRESTEGVLASVFCKNVKLNEIETGSNPLVLVLENIEKPGNIGAMLRTADACRADAVLLCNCRTDIYNPNVIRSSLGAFFTNTIAECSCEEAYQWLKSKGISILTAQLQDSRPYYDTDMRHGTAIVLGSEDKGLTGFWRERSDSRIMIPMLGKTDSLNVSVSAAILCYEAVRQRMKAL